MSRPPNPFHKAKVVYTFYGAEAFYQVINKAMREGAMLERERIVRALRLDLNLTKDPNLAARIARIEHDPLGPFPGEP